MPGIDYFVREMGSRGIRRRWDFLLTMAFLIVQSPSTADSASIDIKPLSQAVVVGSGVRIECARDSSDEAVTWEFAPAGSDDFSFIYTNRQIPTSLVSRYRIDTDGDVHYDILILNVDRDHAGTYICTPLKRGAPSGTSASAQLVVLASEPVCKSNSSTATALESEGVYFRMWCTVRYTGNLIPVMEWNSTIDARHITVTSNKTAVTSSLTMRLTASDNGVIFACATWFNPPTSKLTRTLRRGETEADNVPDYAFMWIFTYKIWLTTTSHTVFVPVGLIWKIFGGIAVVGGMGATAGGAAYKRARSRSQSSERLNEEMLPQVGDNSDLYDNSSMDSRRSLKLTA